MQSHDFISINLPIPEKGVSFMDFCFNCGSRLVPKKIKSEGKSMLVLACNKCGQKIKDAGETLKSKIKIIEHSPKQLVSIIDKENQL
jgi:DNA-directed RNA polymerase subunit M/transcription elongation factor TFIIS